MREGEGEGEGEEMGEGEERERERGDKETRKGHRERKTNELVYTESKHLQSIDKTYHCNVYRIQ